MNYRGRNPGLTPVVAHRVWIHRRVDRPLTELMTTFERAGDLSRRRTPPLNVLATRVLWSTRLFRSRIARICVTRAWVLAELWQRTYPWPEIHVGVRTGEDAAYGHIWLEVSGDPLLARDAREKEHYPIVMARKGMFVYRVAADPIERTTRPTNSAGPGAIGRPRPLLSGVPLGNIAPEEDHREDGSFWRKLR